MPPLMIYPEGITSNGTILYKFKKGSFLFHSPLKINAIKTNFNRLTHFYSEIANPFVLSLLGMCNWYNTITFYEFEGVYDPTFLNLNINDRDSWKLYME